MEKNIIDELARISNRYLEMMFNASGKIDPDQGGAAEKPPFCDQYSIVIGLVGEEKNGQIVYGMSEKTAAILSNEVVSMSENDEERAELMISCLAEFANTVAGDFLASKEYREKYSPLDITPPIVWNSQLGENPGFLRTKGRWSRINVSAGHVHIYLSVNDVKLVNEIAKASEEVEKNLGDNKLLNPFVSGLLSTIETYTGKVPKLVSYAVKKDTRYAGDITTFMPLAGIGHGCVCLSFSKVSACALASEMFKIELTQLDEMVEGSIGEFANAAAGSAKEAFSGTDMAFNLGLPVVHKGAMDCPNEYHHIEAQVATYQFGGGTFEIELRIEARKK